MLLLLVCAPKPAAACEPIIRGHRAEFKDSSMVFAGTVLAIRGSETELHEVVFKVDRRWKGNGSGEQVVASEGLASCGAIAFEVGRQYVVYAREAESGSGYKGVVIPGFSRSGPLPGDALESRQRESAWFRFRSRLPF